MVLVVEAGFVISIHQKGVCVMSIYTSQGTIRIRCDTKAAAGCCDTGNATIYVVPEKDYSIKHRNENYAVFVPQSCGCQEHSCDCAPQSCGCQEHSCDCTPQYCKNAIIRKYNPDKGNGIKIYAAGCINVVSDAAAYGKKVQVEVKATLNEGMEDKIKCKADAVKRAADAAKRAEGDERKQKLEDLERVVNDFEKVVNKSKQCFKLISIMMPA